ncbi:A24 family peptidase [Paenibacillus alvei]|uniref:A24 family peptidase n=2 Tax=Paenibacillus alvei TaxID=44250 RepID=A0ABT4H7E6_PAEAL|nr:A24 family peptidase [Paenibacillus alvei]EJW14345.1 Flp pilus assembly protein CpaA [Paenibacillus alvei DSM 29]MCY9542840.1 A24 family peptidase [Paenibacillus alvei]MCY9736105.1 A24 family peptidase [Paenibacillus alvei]MCY9757350.1 A24 family peptidase [Paenibacillus alvei]MCY9764911.1 A24 family peptidase [Paenibacillus alvei]
MTETLLYFGLGFLLLYFTFTDIRERRIPNVTSLSVILIFLIYRSFDSPIYLWGLVPSIILIILFLFNPRIIGGGDIKMFACVGLIVGLSNTMNILFWTSVTGLLFLFLTRLGMRGFERQPFPLAPFTAVGYILAMSLNVGGLA